MKIPCYRELPLPFIKIQIYKLVVFFLGISSVSYSQDASSADNIENAVSLYDLFTGSNAPVYNGKEYVFYAFRMKGDPYFASAEFSKGWVCYEGKKYDSVSLLYDLTRNELIILNADRRFAIVLHNESVDSFSLSNNKFIKLDKDEKKHLGYAGFYNVLYDGHVQLLALRKKVMSDLIENYVVFKIFTSQDRFFIFKNDTYYPVSNSKDIFRVLSDKRKPLKKMLRHNHVKIKKNDFENSIKKAVEFYDEIGQ
jgi:hypothetical protein